MRIAHRVVPTLADVNRRYDVALARFRVLLQRQRWLGRQLEDQMAVLKRIREEV